MSNGEIYLTEEYIRSQFPNTPWEAIEHLVNNPEAYFSALEWRKQVEEEKKWRIHFNKIQNEWREGALHSFQTMINTQMITTIDQKMQFACLIYDKIGERLNLLYSQFGRDLIQTYVKKSGEVTYMDLEEDAKYKGRCDAADEIFDHVEFTNQINDSLFTSELNESSFTHRIVLISNDYKVKARLAKPYTRKELLDVSSQRYKNSFTLIPKHKEYRAPNIEELRKVIEILREFPEAQKMAINDLDQLENLL